MKKKFLTGISPLLIFLNSIFLQAIAQNADYFFYNYRFAEALPSFLAQIPDDASNCILNYKIGKIYLESRSEKEAAIPYLEKAVHSSNGAEVFPVASKDLGDAYFYARRFSQAYNQYLAFLNATTASGIQQYVPSLSIEANLREEAQRKMEMCLFAMEILDSVDYPFYAPDNSRFFYDFIINADTNPVSLSVENNISQLQYEATVAISNDGQVILMYKNVKGNAELYAIGLNNNKWSSKVKLSRPVNFSGWEKNESLSPDGSVMYFTSSRQGGFGGKDIYYCEKLDDGSWGKAKNLGPVVNTAFDEEAPFIYPDGITLFFSSNRNKNGGIEIFSSFISEEHQLMEAEMVGYPEPSDNGRLMAASNDNSVADMEKTTSVNTEQPEVKKEIIAPENSAETNFILTFLDQSKSPLIIFKGQVKDATGSIPVRSRITVTDNESSKVMAVYLVDQSGKFMISLPAGKNSNITFSSEGYLFHSVNVDATVNNIFFQETWPVRLMPLLGGSSVKMNNVFFTDSNPGYTLNSLAELDNVFRLLKTNNSLSAEIFYCMEYNKRKAKTNSTLSQQRAQSVAEYLIKRGIHKSRIKALGSAKVPKGLTAGSELRITGIEGGEK